MSIETPLLTGLQALLDQLLNLSMDGEVPPEERQELLEQARALRKGVVKLSARQFDQHSAEYRAASTQLEQVQAVLSAQEASVAQLNQALGQVGSLLSALDALAD